MEIVSGRTGKPHVTSQQFRQLIEGTVGQESCILTSGENLEPELASNNSLKIRSGMLAHHGNISSVKIGTYDEVGLSNGSQGMKRIDLVVCRYTKNAETEVENCDWVVIMGTPAASNPVAPAYTVGNLQNGDLVDDCPIFEVHYDGINVTEVKKLVPVVSNLTELNSNFNSLRKNIQMFFAGSRVCNISPNDNTSVSVISNSDINKVLGISDASNANVAVSFSNGDGGIQKVHVQGATYENGTWYATLASGAKAGSIRINYIITYFGTSTSSSSGGSSSAKVQSKTITPRTSEQVVTPDTGYDYLAEVTVQGIPYSEQDDSSGGTTVNIG